MKKLLTFIILLIICSTSLLGQSNHLLPTPNAAEFGRFGRFPVSYYRGIPDISIPLHTVKLKNMEIPIALSYYSNGIKPDQNPGWTGIGWTLKSGGSITRVQNGDIDEYNYNIACNSLDGTASNYNYGFYYGGRRHLFYSPNWQKNLELINYGPEFDGQYDLTPDEFIFNAPGISGSFFFDWESWSNIPLVKVRSNDGSMLKVCDVKQVPYSDELEIKIGGESIKMNILKGFFNSFTIINEKGIKYTFGNHKDAIEYALSLSDLPLEGNYTPAACFLPNTWHLTKIETPDGDVVTYSYERDSYVNSAKKLYSLSLTTGNSSHFRSGESTIVSVQIPSYLKTISTNKGELITYNRDISSQLSNFLDDSFKFQGKIWDRIAGRAFNNGSAAKFKQEKLHWPKLSQIVINNLLSVSFDYTDVHTQRLRLKGLRIEPLKTGGSVQQYSFEYNTNLLPTFNSRQTDHWGYYNGITYDPMNDSKSSLFAKRLASSSKIQAEILKFIYYPTGGKTEFIFEPNTFSKIAFDNADEYAKALKLSEIAGGVRIKSIIDYPDKNNQLERYVRNYKYIKGDGSSSGILSGTPRYEIKGKSSSFEWSGNLLNRQFNSNFYMESEQIVNPLSETQGNHVTYSRIIEEFTDGSSSLYEYTTLEDYPDDDAYGIGTFIPDNGLRRIVSKELERGLLKSSIHLSSNKDTVNALYYKYNSDPNRYKQHAKSFPRDHFGGCPLGYPCGFFLIMYTIPIYSFYPYLEQKIEHLYDVNGRNPVIVSTNYKYNTNSQLSYLQTYNSNGIIEETEYKYLNDVFKSSNNKLVYQLMREYNMVGILFETVRKRERKVIESVINTFIKINDLILPSSQKIFTPTLPVSDYKYYEITDKELYDSRFIDKTVYNSYNRQGNILQVTAHDGLTNSYLWGYNNCYPIAKLLTDSEYRYNQHEELVKEVKRTTYLKSIVGSMMKFTIPNFTGGTISHKLEVLRAKETKETWQSIIRLKYNGMSSQGFLSEYGDFNLTHNLPAGDCNVEFVIEDKLGINSMKVITEYKIERLDKMISHFFYESFEEPSTSRGVSAVGLGHYLGSYTVPFTPIAGKFYIVDYKYLDANNKWIYKRTNYTSGMTLSDGTAIDEVRVYPTNAQMYTYTYKPLVGITSETDPNGITTHYEYDTFGRLIKILDNSRNILKQYQYNYKQ